MHIGMFAILLALEICTLKWASISVCCIPDVFCTTTSTKDSCKIVIIYFYCEKSECTNLLLVILIR